MDIKKTVSKLFKKATTPRAHKSRPVNTTPNQERTKRASAYRARLR